MVAIDSIEALARMLEFQHNLKLYHFQTQYYGAHKASDWLHAVWLPVMDQFWEVYQGEFGRLPTLERSLVVRTIPDSEIINYAKKWIAFLTAWYQDIRGNTSNGNLLNLMDEMIAAVYKFTYLVTFR